MLQVCKAEISDHQTSCFRKDHPCLFNLTMKKEKGALSALVSVMIKKNPFLQKINETIDGNMILYVQILEIYPLID